MISMRLFSASWENPLITDFRSRIRMHWLMPRFSPQGALHFDRHRQLVIAPIGPVAPLMSTPQFGIMMEASSW